MCTTHAEVDVISKSYQKGDTVVVIRAQRNRLLNSKPCLSCQAFLRYSNIHRVIYSNKNGTFSTMKPFNIEEHND
jgi:cytidine deaminase